MKLIINMLLVNFYMGLMATSTAYVNVALNKPAYQQHSLSRDDGSYDASNAVDGRKSDLSGWGGQCAVSNGSETATWWVNLTSIHSIHHITIYFRTLNLDSWFWEKHLAGHFLGFSVYVSNTTNISHGTICFKDYNFIRNTIPAVFTTDCFVHGQYVIYYNERLPGVVYPNDYEDYVYIALCEIEVYGCPATRYFGSNCSIPCPHVNCQYCHIETGTCQGCKYGYQGHRCELECDKGSYGIECNDTCGNCRDLERCSNVNGSCLTGCDAGYKGDLCKTQCEKGSYGMECNDKCGHCRDLERCSNVNGSCLTGCDAGYKEDLCKTKCDKGSYGVECNETCGQCRGLNQCSNVNGSCLTRCGVGYTGDLCKTSE